MNSTEEIREIIDRETKAWDTGDVDLLLSIFHPDMVWFWPLDNTSHDPVEWTSPLGRFERERWRKSYSDLFAECDLVRNDRKTVKITVTDGEDGALAVVDIDTLWRNRTSGEQMHWLGRTGKTYVKVDGIWNMIAQSGVLIYP
jgi:ketosteroid isomerase-like protein